MTLDKKQAQKYLIRYSKKQESFPVHENDDDSLILGNHKPFTWAFFAKVFFEKKAFRVQIYRFEEEGSKLKEKLVNEISIKYSKIDKDIIKQFTSSLAESILSRTPSNIEKLTFVDVIKRVGEGVKFDPENIFLPFVGKGLHWEENHYLMSVFFEKIFEPVADQISVRDEKHFIVKDGTKVSLSRQCGDVLEIVEFAVIFKTQRIFCNCQLFVGRTSEAQKFVASVVKLATGKDKSVTQIMALMAEIMEEFPNFPIDVQRTTADDEDLDLYSEHSDSDSDY